MCYIWTLKKRHNVVDKLPQCRRIKYSFLQKMLIEEPQFFIIDFGISLRQTIQIKIYLHSSIEKHSCFFEARSLGGDQPNSAQKLIKASGKTPCLFKSEIDISPFLLLNFLSPTVVNKGMWMNFGQAHPNALYRAICLGVEGSHCSPHITWVIPIKWSSTTFAR